MGVCASNNFSDGHTPMCNDCGVALCWDISDIEYQEAKAFWDAWICQDCNGGQRLSLKSWRQQNGLPAQD